MFLQQAKLVPADDTPKNSVISDLRGQPKSTLLRLNRCGCGRPLRISSWAVTSRGNEVDREKPVKEGY